MDVTNIQLLVVRLGTRDAAAARLGLLRLARGTGRLQVIDALTAVLRKSVNNRARLDAVLVLGEIPGLLPLCAVVTLGQVADRKLSEASKDVLQHAGREAAVVFTSACASGDRFTRRRAALVLNAVSRYGAVKSNQTAVGLATALRSREKVVRVAAQSAMTYSLA